MFKVLALDYDGTTVNSFRGRFSGLKKRGFSFVSLRPLYFIGEIIEACVGSRWKLHVGVLELLQEATERGLLVGIVTDRSLFSFVISARRAGLPLEFLDFVHARKSIFDFFVRRLVPDMVIMTTPYFKGDKRALTSLVKYLDSKDIKPEEVLFIGDSDCDRIASEQFNFRFASVDRMSPNFKTVLFLLRDGHH